MTENPPPISYAVAGLTRPPPIDWGGTFRQAVFALGVGLLMLGVGLWLSQDGRIDSSPGALGIGGVLVCLAIPWPGRVGRRRMPPEPS